jgi:hypothetical protein
MPNRPAIVRQRDVRRIPRGAKATGVELRIVVRDGQAVFEPIDGKLSESGEQQRPVDEELKGYL